MGKKLTIEFVRESFEKEGYTLLSEEYIKARSKLNYVCSNGHKHSITYDKWKQGKRCPFCARNIKPSIEFVRTSFEAKGYILLSKEYTNSHTKLNYICPKGHLHSIEWNSWRQGRRCSTCHRNNYIGQNHFAWKGGVTKLNLPLYDTYSHQIDYCEETRKDPNNLNLLQVKCTKCNKWFTPKMENVRSRIASLNSLDRGENRFYCSDECKYSCSIFNKIKYSAEEKQSKKYINNPNFTSAELNVWSKEVLKRADYICEYCGGLATQAHHIQPKKLEPFFALDPANGIACCETCHYKHGHKDECSTGVLATIVC